MTIRDAGPLELGPLAGTRWAGLRFDHQLVDLWTALEQAAARWPDARAWEFVDGGGAMSWSEVRDRATRLAGGLAQLGVEPGDHVGTLMGNIESFPLAWLAIARLGAVIVPLNPRFIAREIDFIAQRAQLDYMMLDGELYDTFERSQSAGDRLRPDRRIIVQALADHDGHRYEDLMRTEAVGPPAEIDPRDLHTIQFTSGTTGMPKGCMLSHAYWVMCGRLGAAMLGHPRRILADYPFYYMQNQWYLATAMAEGAQMFVTRGLSRRRFLGWLSDYAIDMAWVSDGMLDIPPSPADRGHVLKLGPADELNPARHRELQDRFGIAAREWYASTEIGLGTMVPWDADDLVGSGAIGFLAPYRETRIVDETLQPVADGEVGELLVRGPHMMHGYWDQPEVNDALFVDGGWFRTGDLCHRSPDGLHFFDGRIKDMIRRSGENIAAQEVEAVLEGMPQVREAAVFGVPDQSRGEEVMAVVSVATETTVDEAQIAQWCAERLASFKRPRFIEIRTEPLPRTGSGKIAKAELRAGEVSGETAGTKR